MRTLLPSTPIREATQPTNAVPAATAAIATTPNAADIPASKGRAERAHLIVARALLGGVALQIFFAGLGVFAVTNFLPHAILGTLVILGSLALPLIAWRGHLSASLQRRSWLVLGLMILQGLLIDAGRLVHVIAAFHPVNAMVLVLFLAGLARIPRGR